jgi:hypothetical protein
LLDSMPDLLSGTFLVTVRFPLGVEQTDPARIRNLLEGFLLAIDRGFFDAGPGRLGRVSGSTEWEEAPGGLRVRFSGTDLHRFAFTILGGMFVGHARHLGDEITSVTAQHDGSVGDLLTSPAPPFPPLGELRFAAEVPAGGNQAKSLRVWLDFHNPIPENERDGLIELFAVWDALVLGPFPAPGRAVGDSWAGPAMTSYLLPTRLEHFVEDYESGPVAFDVLLRALMRLDNRLPIESLEIE